MLGAQVERMLADRRAEALHEGFRRSSGSRSATCSRRIPTASCSRRSTTRCARRWRRRRSCSSRARCARIARSRSCCAPTTRSSTSSWRGTTASPTSTAAISAASTLTDERRHGLLGQASVLTVTSYANRTSVVLRGKWVLENLLGAPPPPPPPNVPPLKENDGRSKPTALRERMEQHRTNPVCASCHSRMDPLGFALEHFDAIGQWRETDSGARDQLDDHARRPRRSTARRRSARRCSTNDDEFVRTVTEKLLTYALGRGVEYYDAPQVRQIVRGISQRNEYRWSSSDSGHRAAARRSRCAARPSSRDDAAPTSGTTASAAAQVRRRHMIITKNAPVAARPCCAALASRSRCRCSTAWCRRSPRSSKTAAAPVRRLGVFYVPERHVDAVLVAEGRRRRSRSCPPTLRSLDELKDRVLLVRRPGRRGGQPGQGRQRRPCAIGRDVPDRRAVQGDVRRRRVRGGLDGSDRGGGVVEGDPARVARARHRVERDARRLRRRRELRVHQHDRLAARRPRRCRSRTIRAPSSSGCSAPAAAPTPARGSPACSAIAAFSTSSAARSSSLEKVDRAAATRSRSTEYLDRFATSSGASRWPRQQNSRELPVVDQPVGVPERLRRARQADDGPAGAGVSDRPDAHQHVHAGARGQRPRVSGDRRVRLASSALAPPGRGRQARTAAQDQRVPLPAVRLSRQEAGRRCRKATA